MEEVLAKLVVVCRVLVEVAQAYPAAGVALDRALADIDLAARIIEGSQELTACAECGLTVEDGECGCEGEGWPCTCDHPTIRYQGSGLWACDLCGGKPR